MKTVQLTPKQISRILNVELEVVMSAIAKQFWTEKKSRKEMLKKSYDCTNLKIMQKSHLDNNKEFDLLGETIKQVNKYHAQVMYQICHSDPCIKKISFVSNFTYYDEIMDDEKVKQILNTLKRYHEEIYGKKTPEYLAYQRREIITNTKTATV